MNFLRFHRYWIALLALALIIIGANGPLLHIARDEAAHNLAATKEARVQVEQNLLQLRADVATAVKLSSQMDQGKAERYLAPADRLKTTAMLMQEAEHARIAHFFFALLGIVFRLAHAHAHVADIARMRPCRWRNVRSLRVNIDQVPYRDGKAFASCRLDFSRRSAEGRAIEQMRRGRIIPFRW